MCCEQEKGAQQSPAGFTGKDQAPQVPTLQPEHDRDQRHGSFIGSPGIDLNHVPPKDRVK